MQGVKEVSHPNRDGKGGRIKRPSYPLEDGPLEGLLPSTASGPRRVLQTQRAWSWSCWSSDRPQHPIKSSTYIMHSPEMRELTAREMARVTTWNATGMQAQPNIPVM